MSFMNIHDFQVGERVIHDAAGAGVICGVDQVGSHNKPGYTVWFRTTGYGNQPWTRITNETASEFIRPQIPTNGEEILHVKDSSPVGV